MLAKKKLFSFLLFVSLLNLIFNPMNVIFGLILIITAMYFLIHFSYNHRYLLPFYIYPFMFVIRNQVPENILIILLPELTLLIATTFGVKFLFMLPNNREGY